MTAQDAVAMPDFCATFKWASERTSFQNEIVEAARMSLATRSSKAYRRGDLFEKRRRLMQQWATFCAASPTKRDGNITVLRSRMTA